MSHLVPVPFIALAVFLLMRAEFRSDQRQIYLLKPLSTLLVILVAALSFSAPGIKVGYTAGVLVGLILSLGFGQAPKDHLCLTHIRTGY